MIYNFIETINKQYTLTEKNAGEFAEMKIRGMKFKVQCFDAEGLGAVTFMTASGMMGLMKMDTVVINPKQKDLPLLSYDRILAMGNDTLIIELYDTLSEGFEAPMLDEVLAGSDKTFDYDPGKHWYDDVKLPQCVYKKGKKKQTPTFSALVDKYLEGYLTAPTAEPFDNEVKQKKVKAYVDGLLQNGGPSTDVFKKELGEEKTREFFHKVFFRTEE